MTLLLLFACQDQSITATNAAPTATIVSHVDEDAVYAAYEVELRGLASDADDAAADLSVSWVGPDGVLCAGPPAEDGVSTCVASFGAGTTTISMEVSDPEAAVGTDRVTLDVQATSAPSVTVVSPSPDGAYYSDRLVTLEAVVDDGEDDIEDLTVWWTDVEGNVYLPSSVESDGTTRGYVTLAEGQHAFDVSARDTTENTTTESVVFEVGPPNTAPECSITEPSDGTAVQVGDLVWLRASVSDVDVGDAYLLGAWSSDRDGLLAEGLPPSGGVVTTSTESLSEATHVLTFTATDDVGDACVAQVTLVVGEPPVIDLVEPDPGFELAEDQLLTMSVTVEDEDLPTALSYAWTSDIDGVLSTTGASDDSGTVTVEVGPLTIGTHNMTVVVTDSAGLESSDGTYVVVSECGGIKWYRDADEDGHGDETDEVAACDPPSGYVSGASDGVAYDCDDGDPTISPSEDELCDEIDQDCDLVVDELPVDGADYYLDADVDGWGADGSAVPYCDQPSGTVAVEGDCDDTSAAISPDAEEVCGDGVDDDCSGADDPCGVQVDLADVSRIEGVSDYDYAGWAVDGPGDVTGDGVPDLLVGAYGDDTYDTNAGAAYVVTTPIDITNLHDSEARLLGEEAADYAGYAVSGAGDQDGDGLPDVLVGAWGDDDNGSLSGKVYLLVGPISGDEDLADAEVVLTGPNADDLAGASLGSGDITGDGTSDLLIGAYGSDSETGVVFALTGPVTASIDLDDADAVLTGSSSAERAGYAVDAVDLDGDGTDELLIGASLRYDAGTPVGAAYVVEGPVLGEVDLADADATYVGEDTFHYAGRFVGGSGDVDGDGTPELLVGADGYQNNTGALYVVPYATSGEAYLVDEADAILTGASEEQYAGRSAAGGDLDADGYGDLVVGAWKEDTGDTDAGGAYLILGPVSGTTTLTLGDGLMYGEASGDYVGFAVAGVGDIDNDGLGDVLIGAYGQDDAGTDAGAVYLVTGAELEL